MGRLYVTGGRVLRPDGAVERADVVLDASSGTVEAVAAGTDPGDDPTLDASDGLVVPGLVNAHAHVAMTLLRGHADDKPLHAWLEEDVFPVEAALTPDDVAAGARLGLLEAIKGGTTSVCDMYFHEGAIAEAVVEAGVRATLGYGIVTLGKDDAGVEAELDAARSFVEQHDGHGSGRVRAALMPHAVRTVEPSVLERVADLARERDLPVHVHANETRDDVERVRERDGRRPIETLDACGVLDAEAFVAHGVHLDEAEIALLAATDTGVAHCPTANLKLASGIAPVRALRAAGVPLGIGTDGPASNNDLDMLEELRLAALLAKVREDDATAIPASAAVEAATRGGASLLGVERYGLEPGAPADLAVIDLRAPHFAPDHDLVSHLAYVAKGPDVRHTVCDGRVLMRDGTVTTLDEAAVRERATRRARALIERAG
ncbi:MAG: amidohydrolase [Halobacteriales archaeon]